MSAAEDKMLTLLDLTKQYDWACGNCMVGYMSQDIERSCGCRHPLCPKCKRHLDPYTWNRCRIGDDEHM